MNFVVDSIKFRNEVISMGASKTDLSSTTSVIADLLNDVKSMEEL